MSEAQTRLLHNYNAVGTSEVERSSYEGSEVVFHEKHLTTVRWPEQSQVKVSIIIEKN